MSSMNESKETMNAKKWYICIFKSYILMTLCYDREIINFMCFWNIFLLTQMRTTEEIQLSPKTAMALNTSIGIILRCESLF